MTDVNDFAALVRRDRGLCVVSTLRAAGTIQSTVINAGVLDHPVIEDDHAIRHVFLQPVPGQRLVTRPPATSIRRLVATASSIRRSCVTSRSVPG